MHKKSEQTDAEIFSGNDIYISIVRSLEHLSETMQYNNNNNIFKKLTKETHSYVG